jgi:hypothetical protein
MLHRQAPAQHPAQSISHPAAAHLEQPIYVVRQSKGMLPHQELPVIMRRKKALPNLQLPGMGLEQRPRLAWDCLYWSKNSSAPHLELPVVV